MLQRIVSALAALVLALGLGFIVSSNAVAAPTPMGGGSGIIIDNQLVCTLTTIGHDNGGRLVGITAGHCGGPGSSVIPESNEGAGVVGTFVESNPELDYGVIQFDPAKVTPVRTVGAATITSIGAPASFPATACKEGRTTGTTCGVVWGDLSADASTWTQICVDHGDSGAPVTVGTTLVAMVNAYLWVPCLGPELGTNMTSIVDTIDAHGGVGAGYRPI
ncbi:S1 family peptidase [Rhodococcus sp. GB-02]